LIESLKQQLNSLQIQLMPLNSLDRAKERVREHRRKQESISDSISKRAEGASKKRAVELPSVLIQETGNKAVSGGARKRDSWATRSKAGVPAPRASVSVGENQREVTAEGSQVVELGCSTKLVYPGDSLWDLHSCVSKQGEPELCSTGEGALEEDSRFQVQPQRLMRRSVKPKLKPAIAAPKRRHI
jgi:hypothetical protein